MSDYIIFFPIGLVLHKQMELMPRQAYFSHTLNIFFKSKKWSGVKEINLVNILTKPRVCGHGIPLVMAPHMAHRTFRTRVVYKLSLILGFWSSSARASILQ